MIEQSARVLLVPVGRFGEAVWLEELVLGRNWFRGCFCDWLLRLDWCYCFSRLLRHWLWGRSLGQFLRFWRKDFGAGSTIISSIGSWAICASSSQFNADATIPCSTAEPARPKAISFFRSCCSFWRCSMQKLEIDILKIPDHKICFIEHCCFEDVDIKLLKVTFNKANQVNFRSCPYCKSLSSL